MAEFDNDESGEWWDWDWVEVTDYRPTVPEFIEARAKGHMKMEGGKLWRKTPIEPDYDYHHDYDYEDALPI